jgi:hypothetical protein
MLLKALKPGLIVHVTTYHEWEIQAEILSWEAGGIKKYKRTASGELETTPAKRGEGFSTITTVKVKVTKIVKHGQTRHESINIGDILEFPASRLKDIEQAKEQMRQKRKENRYWNKYYEIYHKVKDRLMKETGFGESFLDARIKEETNARLKELGIKQPRTDTP